MQVHSTLLYNIRTQADYNLYSHIYVKSITNYFIIYFERHVFEFCTLATCYHRA